MNPIILIPARLGSSRLPNKPLAEIAGLPMVVHVLNRAREAAMGPVAVACGEAAIAEAITRAGGTAILTDPALPSGSDRIWAALQRIDPSGRHDVIINLQGDLPVFPPGYLSVLLGPLERGFDIATLVAPVATEAEAEAASVVKCACAFADNEAIAPALFFSRARIPFGAGPLWHHIGVYAYRRRALERFVALPESPLEKREKLEQLRALEAGMRVGVVRVGDAPFGVDTAADLARARQVLERSHDPAR